MVYLVVLLGGYLVVLSRPMFRCLYLGGDNLVVAFLGCLGLNVRLLGGGLLILWSVWWWC